jgi:hypothetical protein
MKKLAILFAVLGALTSCAHLDYIGENYAPTTQVDMFFDEADVKKDYKVMGHVIYTEPVFLGGGSDMQKKILEKARAVGADGVLIIGFDRKKTGESTNYSENVNEKATKKGKNTSTTGSVSTSSQEEREVRATFIKYR